MRLSRPVLVIAAMLLPLAGFAQERSEKAKKGGSPQFWPEVADQVDPMVATFLGGKGTEWLSGGGFQADGTIVLVGTCLGPELSIGKAETVIGTDMPSPAEPKFKTDAKGKVERPTWTHPAATGFVVRMDRDLRKILSVSRLPWTAGSITSCVVDPVDNAIYIAGASGEGLAKMAGQHQSLEVAEDVTRKGGLCNATYVAKLSPDGAKVLWLRTTKGKSDGPRLQLRNDRTLSYGAQDLRSFSPDGTQLSCVVVPGGITETSSVSPIDGTVIRGGEHMWGTGREPWRCPTLNVLKPDGKLRYQLYDWGGPYVGLDNCRQVSDSAVRGVTHDRDGNILVYAWSDGGNSVMVSPPTDVRTGVGYQGLGLNSAGAGATSFSYLVRLEPKDFQVIGWTFWCSKYGHKANGIGITDLAFADDGSVCIAGGSAWGVIQTKNRISDKDAEPGGNYCAVFSSEMSRVRFCSVLPGVGGTSVTNDNNFALATGLVDGKPRCLVLGGAVKEENVYGWVSPTPVKDAVQKDFAGGASDGWVMMLDLSKTAPPTTPLAPPRLQRLDAGRDSRPVGAKAKPASQSDLTITLSSTSPKYATVDAEFRDTKQKMWPNVMCGRPLSGTITVKDGKLNMQGQVSCDAWSQTRGEQDRRVLGEIITEEGKSPRLILSIDSLGEARTEEIKITDNHGKDSVRSLESAIAKGTLEIGSLRIPVTPKITWSFQSPGRDGAVNGIRMTAWMTFKGKILGLTGKLADEDIDARISWTGSVNSGVPPKKGRK